MTQSEQFEIVEYSDKYGLKTIAAFTPHWYGT